MKELSPCPFCGGPAKFDHYSAYSAYSAYFCDSSFDYVGCNSCEVMMICEPERYDHKTGKWSQETISTINMWNKRVTK